MIVREDAKERDGGHLWGRRLRRSWAGHEKCWGLRNTGRHTLTFIETIKCHFWLWDRQTALEGQTAALGYGRSKSPRTGGLSTAAARPALQNHSVELGEMEKGMDRILGCFLPHQRPHTGRLQVSHWAGLQRAEGRAGGASETRSATCEPFKVVVTGPRSANLQVSVRTTTARMWLQTLPCG